MSTQITFQTVGDDPQGNRHRLCRRMLVGPWCNQPEQYEGYNGFVGWAGTTRLRSGRWIVTFSSGYWHGSPPWTDDIRRDEACRKEFEHYQSLGCMDIRCPRGGRAHQIVSDDEGKTWSMPRTLIDTDMDDRHPTILELDDGSLLATWMAQRLPRVSIAQAMRSEDGGRTWSEPVRVGETMLGFGNGSAIQLRDGTVVLAAEGPLDPGLEHNVIGVFRSTDRGRTFGLAAVIAADHELNEPSVAELPDGRLVLIARQQGDLSFSDDGGCSWTAPVALNVKMSDPHLLMLPNGVLACFHGAWDKGGVAAILSPDGGRTWRGPQERFGYWVDPSIYGYCHPMLLPDGTVYVVYQHNGGVKAHDARTQAVWGLRLCVSDRADGIEILPAPGSPAERGIAIDPTAVVESRASELELGDQV
ncbi:MAG: exo-alpha-sialidase [Phycisphaerae bacterium]|nr:exo-alpha-sialidase [Phycisphaerae bacterium]